MLLHQIHGIFAFVIVLFSIQPGVCKVDKIVVNTEPENIISSIDNSVGEQSCSCSSAAIGQLTPLQKLELELNAYEMADVSDLEEWLSDPANQRPVITLTSSQKQKIKNNFGELFKSKEEMEAKISKTGAVPDKKAAPSATTSPKLNTGSSRKKRSSYNGVRVCPAIESYEALVLAIDENNQLVQVVQMPEDGSEQWFLQESCEFGSSPVSVASCAQTNRLVNAYIIHLASGNMQYGNIKVHSCVGYV